MHTLQLIRTALYTLPQQATEYFTSPYLTTLYQTISHHSVPNHISPNKTIYNAIPYNTPPYHTPPPPQLTLSRWKVSHNTSQARSLVPYFPTTSYSTVQLPRLGWELHSNNKSGDRIWALAHTGGGGGFCCCCGLYTLCNVYQLEQVLVLQWQTLV